MRILIGCEYSGVVRDAFRAAGHDAVSCDLLPSQTPGPHFQCDIFEVIEQRWDAAIFFPPCTFLCSSGLHWNTRRPGRAVETEKALKFVAALLNADVPAIALENPIGCISTRIRKYNQIIQPYQFGDDASKSTCLWLKNLPPLRPTQYVEPRIISGKKRWSNQTDSGQNRLGPSETRALDRAKTYPGIAAAMADQWG